MKVEFSLNYHSLLSERRSLNYQSGVEGSGQVNQRSSHVLEDKLSLSTEYVSLGLYQDKQVHSQGRPDTRLSPFDAANNILGFVEKRLFTEAQGGADDERLKGLLASAKEGVELGYSQGIADLEALGLFDEKVAGEVQQSYDLVQQGMAKLEEQYFGQTDVDVGAEGGQASGDLVGEGVGSTPDSQISNDARTFDKTAQSIESVFTSAVVSERRSAFDLGGIGGEKSVSSLSALSKTKSSADFELVTQDGDTVSISFAQKNMFAFRAREGVNTMAIGAFSMSAERFDIRVNGDLDEDELKAINDLLTKISEVSEKFFDGEFMGAFKAAQNLGFDFEEIASFSLDLSMRQVEKVKAYQSGTTLEDAFRPLSDQAGRVLGLKEMLGQLSSASDDIFSLMDQVLTYDYLKSSTNDIAMLDGVNKFFDAIR